MSYSAPPEYPLSMARSKCETAVSNWPMWVWYKAMSNSQKLSSGSPSASRAALARARSR